MTLWLPKRVFALCLVLSAITNLVPTSFCFHQVCAMASGQPNMPPDESHHLSMDEYKQLASLLQKARADRRLGECMVFAGIEKEVGPAVANYEAKLSGGQNIPIPLNLNSMITGSSNDGLGSSDGGWSSVPNSAPAPKSVGQKGRDMLATMANAPGTASVAMGSQQLTPSSWVFNAMGELVRADGQPISVPQSQEPFPPLDVRWKSKWNKETGTASAIGYSSGSPAPAVQSNSVPVIPETDAMEVGRAKRSLDAEGEMHDWDLIHAEVLSQLSAAEEMTGKPYQAEAPPQDPNLWWPGVDYSHVDASVKIPPMAQGSVQQWGMTAAEKLPKLDEFGFTGRSYEELVKIALSGHRPLAVYLGWLRSMFDNKYKRQGPSSPGVDLAGYLMAIRYELPVNVDGFRRRFVGQ